MGRSALGRLPRISFYPHIDLHNVNRLVAIARIHIHDCELVGFGVGKGHALVDEYANARSIVLLNRFVKHVPEPRHLQIDLVPEFQVVNLSARFGSSCPCQNGRP